jgi:hypothetical protein
MPANKINWGIGSFIITVVLTPNSINNRTRDRDIVPKGNEINGIADCILERFIDG